MDFLAFVNPFTLQNVQNWFEWGGYFILFETVWAGQTLGKKAFGLRVIQESGVRIGFTHAALRNLARPFDRLSSSLYCMEPPM